ncbi:unnamed protein product [Bursaphelenchus xylophilus]|uniref:lysoplasmalogenase n=1 Tax=Bursaphelenchus xylophilus TaxID=6326 RepID=A0A1I7RPA6_BURXY|nr:unnamed protein product [Bursaphelenchus xylophilus]CAG9095692.1 unnamed protein product [Bursaphelenchus xylophilus]
MGDLMKMAGISQTALVYSGMVGMVYLGTDGFQKNAPFVFTLPVVVLGFITLSTRMPIMRKICTSASFFLLASALYEWSMSPRRLEINASIITASHIFYLLSFIGCVKQWWKSLAVLTTLFSICFAYIVFADLFRSLPWVVLACTMSHSTIGLNFVAAGSVWKKGSKVPFAETAAFTRFIGIFFAYICDVALLSNQFARHTPQLVFYLNTTYYLSQYMLYFANERAF